MATVVIVGGGTGGAAAARLLRRRVGPEHQVILVEKEATLYYRPAFPWLAVGRRSTVQVSRSATLMARHGIQVVIDEALKIEPPVRRLYTQNRTISYDLLIIAAGAGWRAESPAEMAKAGFNLYTMEGAAGLNSRLRNFNGEEIAIVVSSPRQIYPAAPYEYAFLLEDWFKRQGRGKDISITVYTPEPAPLHRFGIKVSEAAMDLLLQRNIRLHLSSPVQQVDQAKQVIRLAHGSFPFDLLLYCPEAAPPPLIRESGLADEDGWLPVDRHYLATREEGVLGIGDSTAITGPDGRVLPKMGSIARRQALSAAENVIRLLKGEKMGRQYQGKAAVILHTGRGSLPFSGNFYRAGAAFLTYPASRLWSPLKTVLAEKRWLKEHT